MGVFLILTFFAMAIFALYASAKIFFEDTGTPRMIAAILVIMSFWITLNFWHVFHLMIAVNEFFGINL